MLSPGVTAVEGDFAAGAVVDVVDGSGGLVARGAAVISHAEIAALRGKRASDMAEGVSTLVVHRDEMVVLSALR